MLFGEAPECKLHGSFRSDGDIPLIAQQELRAEDQQWQALPSDEAARLRAEVGEAGRHITGVFYLKHPSYQIIKGECEMAAKGPAVGMFPFSQCT